MPLRDGGGFSLVGANTGVDCRERQPPVTNGAPNSPVVVSTCQQLLRRDPLTPT